jgi:hypothetical protein
LQYFHGETLTNRGRDNESFGSAFTRRNIRRFKADPAQTFQVQKTLDAGKIAGISDNGKSIAQSSSSLAKEAVANQRRDS